MSTKVVTGECRISFPNLFVPVPQRDDNGDIIEGRAKKYSVMLLIPKKDKATIRKLRAAQEEALEAGVATKFGGKLPKIWKDTIHDCDEEDDLEKYPEREGHWRMSVSANEKYAPRVVDRQLNPVMDAMDVYSGCYCRVSLNAYAYKHPKSGPGVSFGLNNVQKLRDGEQLGGAASSPEDDFEALEELDEDDLI